MADQVLPAAEFQSLPLESIIAAPLRGAVEAQSIAAAATLAFIKSMIKEDGTPVNVEFKLSKDLNGQPSSVTVNAPLLSMVPVPHLRIDSLTTHFKYEINQVTKTEAERNAVFGGKASTVGLLSKFVSISLEGSISSKSREESVMNRSGMLEITVHASEAPIPEGLSRILNMLSKEIPAKEA